MLRKGIGLAVICVGVFCLLGLAHQPSVGGLTTERVHQAWEFYLGTWLHVDQFGATHTFTFYEQGVYGVYVSWEKSDSLLGVVEIASASEAVFFDFEDEQDRYGIVSWESPIEAYGVFFNLLEADREGNDQILLEVYRYVTQGGIESSRENFRMEMTLTRKAKDG